MVSSTFLLPFKAKSNNTAFYHYLTTYKLFFSIERGNGGVAQSIAEFYSRLTLPLTFARVTSAPIVSTVLSYYGDSNLALLGASRTMNLCSNLTLKKNWSFTSFYY